MVRDFVHTHGFEHAYGPVIAFWNKEIPGVLQSYIERVAVSCEEYLPSEYVDEMQGIADEIADLGYGKQLNFTMIVALNLLVSVLKEVG